MSLEFEILTKELSRRLGQLHLMQAAAVAEALAANVGQTKAVELKRLSQFAIAYHEQLFRTAPLPHVVSLSWSLPATLSRVDTSMRSEAQRISELLGRADESTTERILISMIMAYYGLVYLDGLRSYLWVSRALSTSKTLSALPPTLASMSEELSADLQIVVGSSPTLENHTKARRSVYVSFQAAADYFADAFGIAVLERTSDFGICVPAEVFGEFLR